MIEREKFVLEARTGHWSFAELCRRYGVSRKTGYKWLGRFEELGHEGLVERGRAPHSCPHRVPEEAEKLLLDVKRRFPTWGARKVLNYIINKQGDAGMPVESTVNELFKRHDLVHPKAKRRRHPHPGKPHVDALEPNDVWAADFKGEFKTLDGIYCYPLTVTDQRSRYVLACKSLLSVAHEGAAPVFERLFRKHGMPKAILTDNGVPFCSPRALLGLSRLNVWWMTLGIFHLRTMPASPQQNGAHERMHRTLKAETTKPPAADAHAQQRKFDGWRRVFNEERPHEFLKDTPPANHYRHSDRPYPDKITAPQYPDHYELRQVSSAGFFRFKNVAVFVSTVLEGAQVGLEEFDDGLWNIYFYDRLLARFDERRREVRQ